MFLKCCLNSTINLSLVHISRKNRGISPSDVCERVAKKVWDKYQITYRTHLITSAKRGHP